MPGSGGVIGTSGNSKTDLPGMRQVRKGRAEAPSGSPRPGREEFRAGGALSIALSKIPVAYRKISLQPRIALGPKIWLDSSSSSLLMPFVFFDFVLGDPACRGTPQTRLSVL